MVRDNPKVTAGTAILIVFIIFALFGPLWGGDGALKKDYSLSLKPPSADHPFGTDLLGRDLLKRTARGARVSLLIGVLAVSVSLLVGSALGAVSGYFGGWVDALIMRFADIFLALPMILGALLFMALIGPGLFNVVLVLTMLGWAYIARILRSNVISVKRREYVLSAKAVGAGDLRTILVHVVPNSAGPVIIFAVMNVGTAVLAESVLSFLGVGIRPPDVSWGYLLSESIGRSHAAPWLMYFPGLFLTLTVLAFTLLGDGLRGALDSRERNG